MAKACVAWARQLIRRDEVEAKPGFVHCLDESVCKGHAEHHVSAHVLRTAAFVLLRLGVSREAALLQKPNMMSMGMVGQARDAGGADEVLAQIQKHSQGL